MCCEECAKLVYLLKHFHIINFCNNGSCALFGKLPLARLEI